MATGTLLAPHGRAEGILLVQPHRVVVVDTDSGDARVVWGDEDRDVWAATTDLAAERIAVLSAPSNAVSGWTIDFSSNTAEALNTVVLGQRPGTPIAEPDAVAAGRGGLGWIGETSSVAVALPTGGLQQVFLDGSQVPLLSAATAKRPAAVAVTQDAGTIAYVNQPSGSQGSGIYAGSMKAKPVDPVNVLPADRSGNRYARGVAWISPGSRIATVIDREELGNPQGDLFYIDTETGTPHLAWTSPSGEEIWSVESFAISDDGNVVAFLTNPSNPESKKASSLWVMQADGGAIERFALPAALIASRVVLAQSGVAVSGVVKLEDQGPEVGAAYLVTPAGEVVALYQEPIDATPVASPGASPIASPVASPIDAVASPIVPIASPEASPSPRAVTSEE